MQETKQIFIDLPLEQKQKTKSNAKQIAIASGVIALSVALGFLGATMILNKEEAAEHP